jgi:hypothetical protein
VGKQSHQRELRLCIVLGVPESQWTKKEYSQTKKLRAVYAGDDGSNDIVICDAVDGGSLFENEITTEVEL